MEWGSILSGIGSIAGSGVFGGGGDGIDVSENVRLSRRMFDTQMKNLERYKIHPVYGLGAGQGTIAPVTTQSNRVDAGALGAGLGRIAEGMKRKDPTQAAMETLGLRQAKESAEQSGIQTELMRLQLQRERQALNSQQDVGGVKTYPAGSKPADPLYITDYSGNAHKVTRPGLGDDLAPHYPGWEDVEGFAAGLRDRGIPIAKKWFSDAWRQSATRADLERTWAQLARMWARYKRDRARNQYNWPESWAP